MTRGWLAGVLLLGACGYSTEKVGNFVVHKHREEFAGHSRTTSRLTYRDKTLSRVLSDITMDPRNPDRVVFASREPCGTFFFDGKAGRLLQIDAGPDVVGSNEDVAGFQGSSPWSPNGAYVFIGNDVARPTVIELRSGAHVDLSDALSADYHRLSVRAYQWAPSSDRLAVVVEPGGYNDPDRDLAMITLDPLHADYVATMQSDHGGLLMWTTSDFSWDGDALVASAEGKNGPILRRSPADVRWQAVQPRGYTPPRAPSC
jgi:hypothetical protein